MTAPSAYSALDPITYSGVPKVARPITNGTAYPTALTSTYTTPPVAAESRHATLRPVSREEGRAVLDRLARRYLNMSGEEFIRAWDAGEFASDPDRPEVMRVAMLIDLGR